MRTFKKRISTIVLASAMGAGGYAFLVSPMTMPTAEARLRDFPKLEASYNSLKDAKDYLENAPNEFHGHKKDALHAIDEAMNQISVLVDEQVHRSAIGNRPAELAEERHPRLKAARERVKEGREFVKEAKDDFRGHKDEAVKAMDEALRQIDLCLAQ
jgi:hypothetical protein